MKRPPDIKLDKDILAEIEAASNGKHFNTAVFPPEADRNLLAARSGDRPVSWTKITAIFRARGWPSSQETLRRRLAELEGK